MPWHLSKSDPRKVYDSRHEMVCVCQTAEQARIIVDAVVAHGPQTRGSAGEVDRKEGGVGALAS